MRDWWIGLQPRERGLVGLGGAALLLTLLYVLVWEPLVVGLAGLRSEVSAQQANLAWMREASAEIRALNAGGAADAAGLGGRSLLAVVDQTAGSAGLATGIKRVDPEGQDRARVRVEAVEFDKLVLWLDQLAQRYGVQVALLSLERSEGEGLVNVRLTLEAGG